MKTTHLDRPCVQFIHCEMLAPAPSATMMALRPTVRFYWRPERLLRRRWIYPTRTIKHGVSIGTSTPSRPRRRLALPKSQSAPPHTSIPLASSAQGIVPRCLGIHARSWVSCTRTCQLAIAPSSNTEALCGSSPPVSSCISTLLQGARANRTYPPPACSSRIPFQPPMTYMRV